MIVLPSAIIAGGPPRTDIAVCDWAGIRVWGSCPIDNGCETRFDESVIRKEVLQPKGLGLKASARTDDVREIRHASLNLSNEF